MSVIILCVFVKILIWSGVDGECEISIKDDIGIPAPLLIEEKGGKPAFALPDPVSGKITVAERGLPTTSTKYIASTTNRYLARGHLTPKTDFIYGPQQDATFICINAVPQWQTLNAGNWKRLEADLRDLAAAKGDLIIATGMSEILSYPHEQTGRQTPLYIYADSRQKAIPVPKYIWKIAYIDQTKEGIAFVGVNDPYFSNAESVKICNDVCSQIRYLHLKLEDYTRHGYVYCCEVDDLRSRVSNVPTEIPSRLRLLIN
ncbi:hypothetical protein Trydic_g373 [Trypoxylus dichotomus]